MMRAFIKQLAGPGGMRDNNVVPRRGRHGQHPGLLLQRYLCDSATGEDGNPEEKRAILQAAINAAKDEDVRGLYKSAFDCWSASLPVDAASIDVRVAGRLIVGLGSENILETGLRLHHTYGMPIIPGSAIKGLAAHYCDQIWGERGTESTSLETYRFRSSRKEDKKRNQRTEAAGDYHRLLFGVTDDSGCIVFHDGWYLPDSSSQPIVQDVMTPHHPKWNDIDAPVVPTDFDSPIPVPFLSVTGGFRVAVSWCGPEHPDAKKWTELAVSLLKQALADWGIGGKTSSGYGRLVSPPPPQKRLSSTKARVTILAMRPKGGFDVQDIEAGRNPGTLTVGTQPADIDANSKAVVDVLVHNDDQKRPQYKWP